MEMLILLCSNRHLKEQLYLAVDLASEKLNSLRQMQDTLGIDLTVEIEAAVEELNKASDHKKKLDDLCRGK